MGHPVSRVRGLPDRTGGIAERMSGARDSRRRAGSKADSKASGGSADRTSRFRLEALEPRILLSADAAFPVDEALTKLPELLAGIEELHVALGRDEELDALAIKLLTAMRRRERSTRTSPPQRLVDPRGVLHELRLLNRATPPPFDSSHSDSRSP